MSATISQQAVAVESVQRIIAGGAQKPSRAEREYLSARLIEAANTLRWLERNQAKIRAMAAE